MRIKQYTEASSTNDTDVMIIENSTETQHIKFSTLFNSIKSKLALGALALKNVITKTDMDSSLQASVNKIDTIKAHAFSDPVNNLVSTDTTKSLSAAQGKALSDSISALNTSVTQDITELNSNLQWIMPSKNFWMEGGGDAYTLIVDYSDVESSDLSRIPVLVGGNIANQNFLILYNVDLINLSENATLQTGTNIIAPNENFKMSANKDVGNMYRLRLKFELSVNFGAHVFVTIYSHGGKVL